jgi:hypothetical protein
MPESLTAILANFKQIHEHVSGSELKRSQNVAPEGMDWIMRDGKRTNCVVDQFSAIHGHTGPCNCGLMANASKRFRTLPH